MTTTLSTAVQSIERLQITAMVAVGNTQLLVAKGCIERLEQRLKDEPDTPGTCRYCGCQETSPCGVIGGHGLMTTCGWVNEARTICSSLRCLQLYQVETGEPLRLMRVQTSAIDEGNMDDVTPLVLP